MSNKVLVLMSGGVDSTYAAIKAVEHFGKNNVIGVHIKTNDNNDCTTSCCSNLDSQDARRIAEQLDIQFDVLDLQDKFEEKVIKPFVEKRPQGLTVIPCVDCATYIRFGGFIQDIADTLDCTYIASGHYAITVEDRLYAHPSTKNQSYYLASLGPDMFRRLWLPMGDVLDKQEVRDYVRNYDIQLAEKRDSSGLCFVGKRHYTDVLKDYGVEDNPGDIIFRGHKVGTHRGIHYYTVGQRVKNPQIDLDKNTKYYVFSIDKDTNGIYLSQDNHQLSRNIENIVLFNNDYMLYSQVRGHGNLELFSIIYKKVQGSPGHKVVFYNENKQVIGYGDISNT